MYFKQKLAYMALGCLFTIIGYILASLSGNPVDAQSQRDKSEPTVIDEIVCRKLRVVNADGKIAVLISTDSNDGGLLLVKDKAGKGSTQLSVNEYGGIALVTNKNREVVAGLSANEYGGGFDIFNNGKKDVLQAGVHAGGGGYITTRNKYGYNTGKLP